MPRRTDPSGIPDALKYFDQLPDAAHVRQPVVEALYGCSGASVWRGVKAGRIPEPQKLSPGITAWNVGVLRRAMGRAIAMAEEIAKAERLSTTRSAAGKRSAEVRSAVREQVFNKRSARVKHESVSPCHEKIKAVSTKKNLLSVIDTEAGQELPVEGSVGDWDGINLEDFE